MGDSAFRECSNLTSVTASSPCTLGAVGSYFLANTPKLLSFRFHNVAVSFMGPYVLQGSGVEEVDVGGLSNVTFGDTEWSHLKRVIATAPTTVTRFAGHRVERLYNGGLSSDH